MILERYTALCNVPSDINENLPILKKHAQDCDMVVELGVRGIVSTWALLAGRPKRLLSVDIVHPSEHGGSLAEVYKAAGEEGIEFTFSLKSSLEIELPEHDFLFIDTIHTREQLSQELERHASKVKKYIAFHDTHIPELPEMIECILDFIQQNPEWKMIEDHPNNNGITVISRI